jgi:hypothetical protein
MKKRIKKVLMLTVGTLLLSTFDVNAETYFTNLNGVEMTEEEYNTIVNKLSETRALTLTEEQFDFFLQGTVVDSNTLYLETISNQNGILSERYITEEEYNLAPEENIAVCLPNIVINGIKSNDYGYIETTYKRLNVSLTDYGNNNFDVFGSLTWKKVPACRSYDIFAFRTNYMSYSNPSGIQSYFTSPTNFTNITYNTSSSGYNSDTNGAGFSMNLKDGSNITKYEMTLWADLSITNFNYSTAHVYTTYQHAQTDLTQAQSKSYTFSAGGLGDVVYFSNTTIRNKYDGMAGIHLTTPIP